MSKWEHAKEKPTPSGPRSLWEAVSVLVRIQEEEEIGCRQGGTGRRGELRNERILAWSYVSNFAEEMVRRGEAPAGLVARLRRMVRVPREIEEELMGTKLQLEPQGELEERLARAA